MSKEEHTSKVTESTPGISLFARVKAFLGFDHGIQPILPSEIHADEGENEVPTNLDKQKIWKRQIGAILPQVKSKPFLPVKHKGDGEAKQTPSNLG